MSDSEWEVVPGTYEEAKILQAGEFDSAKSLSGKANEQESTPAQKLSTGTSSDTAGDQPASNEQYNTPAANAAGATAATGVLRCAAGALPFKDICIRLKNSANRQSQSSVDQVFICTAVGNIRCGSDKKLDYKGGTGAWALWSRAKVAGGFTFQSVAHAPQYLSLSASGDLCLSVEPVVWQFDGLEVKAESVQRAPQTQHKPTTFHHSRLKTTTPVVKKAVIGVTLQCEQGELPFPVRVQMRAFGAHHSETSLFLSTHEGNLRCKKNGDFDCAGAWGEWAQWRHTEAKEGGFTLASVGHPGKFLSMLQGRLCLSDKPMVWGVKKPEKAAPSSPAPISPAAVQLHCPQGAVPFPVRVHQGALVQGGRVVFLTTPEGNVRCKKDGQFDSHGGRGQWAQWKYTAAADGAFTLQSVGHGLKYLAFTDTSCSQHQSSVPLCLSDSPVLWSSTPIGQAPADRRQPPQVPHSSRPALGQLPTGLQMSRDVSQREGPPRVFLSCHSIDGKLTALRFPLSVLRAKRNGATEAERTADAPDTVVLMTSPGGFVRCAEGGTVEWNGLPGAPALWHRTPAPGGAGRFHLQSPGHGGKHLAVGVDGKPVLSEAPVEWSAAQVEPPVAERPLPMDPALVPSRLAEQFWHNGYVVLKGAVQREVRDNALRTLNQSIAHATLQLPHNKSSSGPFGDVFVKSPVLWSGIGALLQEDTIAPQERRCQIALQFPDPEPPLQKWYIDGMGNGKGQFPGCSLLVGVALSDQTVAKSGNVCVYPGSHLKSELHRWAAGGLAEDAKPTLGNMVEVLLDAGDAVLVHPLLALGASTNESPNIRYQLYYRVKRKDHEQVKVQMMEDPMAGFSSPANEDWTAPV